MSPDKPQRNGTRPIRAVIAGGGTAGHIYPALAVASALLGTEPGATPDAAGTDAESAVPPARETGAETTTAPQAELLYLHGPSRRDAEVMAHAGIPHRRLDVGPIRGAAPHKLIINMFRLTRGVFQAMRAIARFHGDVLLATGGYVSAPAIVAAWLLRVPVVLYLPDASPGMAIRMLSPFARRIALSFPLSKHYFKTSRAIVTGYPVRAEFLQADKDLARRSLNLLEDLPVVMVMGGSTGAHSLNLAVSDALEPLLHHCQLIHLCGESDEQMLRQQRGRLDAALRPRYHLFRYLHRGVADAMAASDLMVCRAGASALAELPILALPAILVPGTFAGGHQEKNADFLVEAGGAVKIPDSQLGDGALLLAVLSLLEDKQRLEGMRVEMRRLARPEAANNIASLVRSVAKRPVR